MPPFTVADGVTSITVQVWGFGGGASYYNEDGGPALRDRGGGRGANGSFIVCQLDGSRKEYPAAVAQKTFVQLIDDQDAPPPKTSLPSRLDSMEYLRDRPDATQRSQALQPAQRLR